MYAFITNVRLFLRIIQKLYNYIVSVLHFLVIKSYSQKSFLLVLELSKFDTVTTVSTVIYTVNTVTSLSMRNYIKNNTLFTVWLRYIKVVRTLIPLRGEPLYSRQYCNFYREYHIVSFSIRKLHKKSQYLRYNTVISF